MSAKHDKIRNSTVLLLAALLMPLAQSFAQDRVTRLTDFDGDGIGDLVGYEATEGSVLVRQSGNSQFLKFDLDAGSVPLLFDPNGDGRPDVVTYNPTNAHWKASIDGANVEFDFGTPGKVPFVGNFTSKDCSDIGYYSRRTARWTLQSCVTGRIQKTFYGSRQGIPVVADYDCDGLSDRATFSRRASYWKIRRSGGGQYRFNFGLKGDVPLPADYDGDGCADPAVYRPSTNQLFYRKRNGSAVGPIQWGLPGDLPAVFNVDGNRMADYSIYRPSDNSYYVLTNPGMEFRLASFGAPVQRLSQRSLTDMLANTGETRMAEVLPGKRSLPLSTHWFRTLSSRVGNSFNGDNRSDLVVLRQSSFANTAWSIRHWDGTTSSVSLGSAGADIVAGDFTGDGLTDPVISSDSGDDKFWTLRDSSGFERSVQFGPAGAKPLSGDYDCDGKNDFAVAEKIAGGLHWSFLLSSQGRVGPLPFGLESDRFFAADMNGDRCDELVLAQEVAGAVHWFYVGLRELRSGGPVSVLPWGLAGDKVLAPDDIDGDGRKDLIVVRAINGGLTFFIRMMSGATEAHNFGFATDTPLTGHFTGSNRAEIAVYRPGSPSVFYIRHQNGFVGGVAFGSSADQPMQSDGRRIQSSGGCDVTRDFFDGGGKALWKPHSDNTGRPVFLLPSEYWFSTRGSFDVLGSNGQLVTRATRRTCCPNGGRGHWDVSQSGAALEAFAPLTIRMKLSSGLTECRTVQHPARRED